MYWSRLLWEPGRGGIAKLNGKEVFMPSPPDLGNGRVWYVDYCPGHDIHDIQDRSIDPRRDMLPAEIKAADALLLKLAGDGG